MRMGIVALFCAAAIAAPAGASATRPGSGEVLESWRVTSGAVVMELDPGVLAKMRFMDASGGEGIDPAWVLPLVGAAADLQVLTRNGQVFVLDGSVYTQGRRLLDAQLQPEGRPSAIGDFALFFSGRTGTLADRADLQRDVFDLASQTISATLDQQHQSLVITAALTISESFADEVLGNPAWQGVPVGTLFADLTVEALDVDAPIQGRHVAAVEDGTRAIGPDVIVSGVGSSLSKYGTVSGITGYAMTTVSCNIGDQEAIWIDCTNGDPTCNQHPVIGQNMYRLFNGRFEQVGMSWLKHGFCAADASGCGSCQSNPSCDWLGLFCTDTYGASLNGTQSALGPRSDVNAYTGVFPYPYSLAWNQSGDAIYKRLQIANADLDPALNSGALYFGESQYVATSEAPRTRFNNLSWRRVLVGSFSGGGYNLSFTGSTVQQETAIEAWPDFEAGVTLTSIDVPDDGRFILGYKVTDLGGGTWHYEYALFNMNSDRSGGAFRVPIETGATVSNVGYHDVDYHSGERYSNLSWVLPANGTAGAALAFKSPKTYALDPVTNALRWGTLYNYRFDANVPPSAGRVVVGLFKPGTPESVALDAMVPGTVGCNADADLDGDVDLADHGAFFGCFTGQGGLTINPTCLAMDCDGDADIDLVDLQNFLVSVTAP